MKAIVAVDKNWGIGKNNDLLFSIPEDMKFFRQTTLGKVVVMGGNTLRSFPNGKPLKNRTNVVLSRTLDCEDCIIIKSFESLISELQKYSPDDVFIIGGAQIYKMLLPYCSEVLVTKVDAIGDADVFYENLDDNPLFELAYESQPIETNGYVIRFTTYKNLETKEL